jgi:hypothetical protein
MSKGIRAGRAVLAAIALTVSASACADWLAADPGTPISLQLNRNGTLVIRPLSGTWSHPTCGDVTAAEYSAKSHAQHLLAMDMLIAAAANGSLVNVYAEPDTCDEHGHPVVYNIRVQGS